MRPQTAAGMARTFVIAACALSWVLLGTGAARAQQPPEPGARVATGQLGQREAREVVARGSQDLRQKVEVAQVALRRGDAQVAAARFEAAALEARALGDRPTEAAAWLDGARALETLDRQGGKSENGERALAWYDAAIASGAPAQSALARNNKGVALLAMGRGGEALAELERVDHAAVSESQRQAFQYNLGRAYEQLGQAPRALEAYRAVVAAQPSFRPAVDHLYGLLRASADPERIRAAAVLTGDLVQRGEPRAALENARECLSAWKAERGVPAMCELLVRSYVANRIGPADYARTERDFLGSVAREAQSAPTGAYLERFAAQLERVYQGELPIDPRPDLARELFPRPGAEWSAEEVSGVNLSAELSRLLKLAGDHFDGSGDPGQALARYLLSWNLDPANTEALVHVAEMVRRDAELATGSELGDSLVSRIFEEKGSSYRVQYKTARDWLNILRYHVLLASIFEQQGRWGSRDEIASVIFQLEHAIAAEARVRRLGEALAPAPGLHYRLGRAYLASGRGDDRRGARQSFVDAARGFLEDGNAPEARLALDAARPLASGEEGAFELRELEARVRALERGR